MTLVPFRRFESLFDVPSSLDLIDRFFGEFAPVAAVGGRRELLPEFDLSETEEYIVLKADLAGIDAKNLDINITDNVLVVKGERKEDREEKSECFHQVERRFGAFTRSFTLPGDVKADGIEATYKDGVLRLTIPKAETAKPKKIEVKVH